MRWTMSLIAHAQFEFQIGMKNVVAFRFLLNIIIVFNAIDALYYEVHFSSNDLFSIRHSAFDI